LEPEHVQFKGAGGWDIEGWLIRPLKSASGRLPPLILHVHGGPYLAFGNTFYFQFQALAASGFASLYINPRGSAGYGQEFVKGRDYGENDYRDLMHGLDAVLQLGAADPARLGVTGLSFGGFMTNWIVGQTDRFAAALTVNGIASWMSMHETSDIGGRWPGVEWGGAYWESEEMWQKFRHHSPISYIGNVRTPLMLFGSENDYRVPVAQEEAMLTALRVQGKIVEMIRFPNANHLIATSAAPHHRVEQWELAQAWFERWLGITTRPTAGKGPVDPSESGGRGRGGRWHHRHGRSVAARPRGPSGGAPRAVRRTPQPRKFSR
jgi:dipeptidyl aminopeptidase/acylaminoacyl peptidase